MYRSFARLAPYRSILPCLYSNDVTSGVSPNRVLVFII